MSVAAVVTAAGSGTRLGASVPKALVELAGEPLIVHAVRGMVAAGVRDVVVTVPADHEAEFERVLAGLADEFALLATPTPGFWGAKGSADAGGGIGAESRGREPGSDVIGRSDEPGADVVRVRCVVGGGTRQESVAHGLAAVDADVVLIHDAARCLTPPAVIRRVVEAVRAGAGAVVPVMPVTDTMKRIGGSGVGGSAPAGAEPLGETVDRGELRAVQTPQGFRTDLVKRAHAEGVKLSASELSAAPDDAALVELIGEQVWAVPGDAECLKITTPFDLAVAEFLCEQRRKGSDV